MDRSKKIILAILVVNITLFAAWYIGWDFSSLLWGAEKPSYSTLVKRFSVFLVAIIAAISGKDSLSKKDSVLLKASFIAICCAETAFLFRSTYGGIVFFLVAQILLILRNSQGLKQKLATADQTAKFKLIICGAAVFAIYILIFAGVFYSILKNSPLLIAFLVYGTVLSISLWVGQANYILSLFPKKNSIMVSIGMVCFFVSDILVGLVMLIKSGVVYQIANSFIWVLYIPAIMLLAFSGYKYSETEITSFQNTSL